MHPASSSERPAPLWPPHEVRTVCATFLALADEAAPGLVEGLYLRGSIAFGEWHAGRSDIDYVVVLAGRPGPGESALLEQVHARLAETFPRPPFDGFHLTWEDLAAGPVQVPDLPCTQAGLFHAEERLDVNPVSWHELAGRGVRVRGPDVVELDVWTDQHALREHTHANLEGYWAHEAAQLLLFPVEAARPDIVTWFVLGVPRLHHLLATDRLTTKDGAGAYAVEAFGEQWRLLVAEALTFRATGVALGAIEADELSAQVIEFTGSVIESGLAIRP